MFSPLRTAVFFFLLGSIVALGGFFIFQKIFNEKTVALPVTPLQQVFPVVADEHKEDALQNEATTSSLLGTSSSGVVEVKKSVSARPIKSSTNSNKVFALTQPTSKNIDDLLADADVDGLALQFAWEAIETSDNVYRFDELDSVMTRTKEKGKQVTLHLLAAPHAPKWLEGKGATYFSSTDFRGRTLRDVVPWDAVYVAQYKEFLTTLALHLKEKGTLDVVFDVSVTVPQAEMNLVTCRDGALAQGVPYDRVKYLAAWKEIGDAYAKAFPLQVKFVSSPHMGLICAPEQDTKFYSELMNYLLTTYDKSFWVFAADLKIDGSVRSEAYPELLKKTGLGYQTIWSASGKAMNVGVELGGTFPDNLKQSVCAGLKNGAAYFEIYQVDVLSADTTLRSALKAVHTPTLCKNLQ